MAGRAVDLLRVLTRADISNDEDDQAVLTDYMYMFPEDVALDYSQSLFGSNRHDVCMFEVPEHGDRFAHIETGIVPFLIHSPGDGDNCHQAMIKVMNATLPMTDQQVSPRALRILEDWGVQKGDNYGPTYSQIVGALGKFCLAAEDKKASDGSRLRKTRKPLTVLVLFWRSVRSSLISCGEWTTTEKFTPDVMIPSAWLWAMGKSSKMDAESTCIRVISRRS